MGLTSKKNFTQLNSHRHLILKGRTWSSWGSYVRSRRGLVYKNAEKNTSMKKHFVVSKNAPPLGFNWSARKPPCLQGQGRNSWRAESEKALLFCKSKHISIFSTVYCTLDGTVECISVCFIVHTSTLSKVRHTTTVRTVYGLSSGFLLVLSLRYLLAFGDRIGCAVF